MERVRRRWWTWTVSAFALLVILAAAVSGAFQFAVLAVPSYREDLSDWVMRVTGRVVDIGGVSLVWRGIYPRLDLSDITLYNDNGDEEVLSAQRLSLGFGLTRLATGDLTPTLIELSGLSLAVTVDAQGNVRIIGLDNAAQDTAPNFEQWLRELMRFRRVRLRDCDLQVTAPHLPETPLHLTLTRADLAQTGSGLEAQAQLTLPSGYGKTVKLTAEIDGQVDKPASWSGQVTAQTAELQALPWLRPLLLPGTRVSAEATQLELKAAFQAGRFTSVDGHFEAGATLLGRAGRNNTAASLDLLAHAAPVADGWQLDVRHLALDGEEQLRGSLRYAALAEGGYELSADADLLRLERLSPWLSFVRDAPAPLALAARGGGEVSGLVVRLRAAGSEPQYSVRAMLKNVALAAGDGPAGFAGLSGELSADENGGRLQLAGGALKLEFPHALHNPVPLQSLSGEVQWSRRADGWQLQMPTFAWTLATLGGQGHLNLFLPADAARSPELDLAASFSAGDINHAKPFIPRVWGEGLHEWLTRAIVSARVPRGELLIHGPLADFPYDQTRTGEWKLDLDVADANLAFLPDWPAIDRLGAHLAFRDNGLTITSDSGDLSGNRVDKVSARFADFRTELLQIDAVTSGETARYYDFLRASPLRQTLAGLVGNTSAHGPARVAVHLEIPLNDAARTSVAGNVSLGGVELSYHGLNSPLREIRGDIAFDTTGARADKLSGRFEDLDLAARILPRPGTHGVITAAFDYAPRADGGGASAFVPEMLRRFISGGGRWTAELPLGDQAAGLSISTDLQGIAFALPPPLGKRADEALPLTVAVGGGDDRDGMRVRVHYGDRLSASIGLAADGDGWKAHGVNLHLGHGAPPAAAGEGVRVTGAVDELDLGAWGMLLGDARHGGMALQQADVHAGRLLFMGQSVRDVHGVYTPDASGWTAKLDGAGAEGELVFHEAGGGVLDARLKRLAVEFQSAALPEEAAAPAGPVFDPAQWPVFDIACEQLSVGGTDLGRLALATSRIAGGQRVDRLSLGGGKTTLGAEGQWTREAGLSSAALKFDLQSQDPAAALRAFGYAPNLDARHSRFTADLAWPPDAGGVSWAMARGRVGIDVQNGSLRPVEPGAGRVLGLINFYALPRRLTLDFRDVVSSGLGFDAIGGHYDLADGTATTTDLNIAAPSLRMEVRGSIGLAARDLDQRVTVYPDVSAGVTLGAALVGGPAVGALVLLAQQVLQKPLDQATQLSYRLTGPWDNPKVE